MHQTLLEETATPLFEGSRRLAVLTGIEEDILKVQTTLPTYLEHRAFFAEACSQLEETLQSTSSAASKRPASTTP